MSDTVRFLALLQFELSDNDYLDGGDGDDYLQGGGADQLFGGLRNTLVMVKLAA